jgi:HlyD family secretion protein
MPNTESIFGESRDAPAASRAEGGAIRAGNGSPRKRGKAPIYAAIALVAVVVAAFFIVLSPSSGTSDFVLKTWSEATVAKATIKNTVSTTGVIELKEKETILAPQTAQVSAVYVDEGDTVKKGQAIAQLATADFEWDLVVAQSSYDAAVRDATMTDTEYDFTVRQQDITIKTAERNLKTADDKLSETQGLFDRNIASQSELTTAKNNLADAKDSLDLAKLTLEQKVAQHKITLTNRASDLSQKKKTIDDLRETIAACTIRSGTAGKVYSLSVAVGDRISSYSAVAVIANPSAIQAGIDVEENRINEVAVGNPVTVTIGQASVPGKVKSKASSATTSSSSSSSTVRVVVDFDSIPDSAIVGGSVSADIEVGVIKDALTLPRGPFLSSGNYASAYVIDASGKAAKKAVTYGISDGTTIQVLSGLGEGDRVITSAYQEFIHLSNITLAK